MHWCPVFFIPVSVKRWRETCSYLFNRDEFNEQHKLLEADINKINTHTKEKGKEFNWPSTGIHKDLLKTSLKKRKILSSRKITYSYDNLYNGFHANETLKHSIYTGTLKACLFLKHRPNHKNKSRKHVLLLDESTNSECEAETWEL